MTWFQEINLPTVHSAATKTNNLICMVKLLIPCKQIMAIKSSKIFHYNTPEAAVTGHAKSKKLPNWLQNPVYSFPDFALQAM